MTYQQILHSLKGMRQANDQLDAAAARRYFKGELGCTQAKGLFTYRDPKNGIQTTCTKDSKIAEVWRSLLNTSPYVRDRVERGLEVGEEGDDDEDEEGHEEEGHEDEEGHE